MMDACYTHLKTHKSTDDNNSLIDIIIHCTVSK